MDFLKKLWSLFRFVLQIQKQLPALEFCSNLQSNGDPAKTVENPVGGAVMARAIRVALGLNGKSAAPNLPQHSSQTAWCLHLIRSLLRALPPPNLIKDWTGAVLLALCHT